MTKKQYIAMVNRTGQIVSFLPGTTHLLSLPTLLCALLYFFFGVSLLLSNNPALQMYILVPAICFVTVSILRKLINRDRPYDFFDYRPVGRYIPGKKCSMPSRHAASVVAVVFAILYVHFSLPLAAFLGILCLVICLLRVFSGQHYPSDVIAGVLLSLFISISGFFLLPTFFPLYEWMFLFNNFS